MGTFYDQRAQSQQYFEVQNNFSGLFIHTQCLKMEAISPNISKIHFSTKFFHFSVKETPDSDFFFSLNRSQMLGKKLQEKVENN